MDLTGFYYAIAGCSGTIVAIVGGFIASKLITISSEREAVEEKLHEITTKLELEKKDYNLTEEYLNEMDALDFIEDNIASLIECEEFINVYKPEEKEPLEQSLLEEYWNRSLTVVDEYSSLESYDDNSDGVPSEFALKHDNYEFEYEVCKLIHEEFDRMEHSHNTISAVAYDISHSELKKAKMIQSKELYSKEEDKLIKIKHDIHLLELEQRMFTEKLKSLKKPKGMKSGLIIFALFSLTGVIYPLLCAVLSMYLSFPDILLFGCRINSCIIPASVFALFIIGIIATYTYLALLLKWKPQKEQI